MQLIPEAGRSLSTLVDLYCQANRRACCSRDKAELETDATLLYVLWKYALVHSGPEYSRVEDSRSPAYTCSYATSQRFKRAWANQPLQQLPELNTAQL